jgi:F-type H+-transporting ATPase subunit delta
MYAAERKAEDKVYAEILALSHAFVKYRALRRVLDNRTLSPQKKGDVVAEVVGKDVSGELRRFVQTLLQSGRQDFLHEICLSFQNIYRREKRLLDVELTTAMPVDKAVEKRLLDKVEKATQHTVRFNAKVKKEIVGGYILKWGTYRIDASVTARLRQMRKKLVEDFDTLKV